MSTENYCASCNYLRTIAISDFDRDGFGELENLCFECANQLGLFGEYNSYEIEPTDYGVAQVNAFGYLFALHAQIEPYVFTLNGRNGRSSNTSFEWQTMCRHDGAPMSDFESKHMAISIAGLWNSFLDTYDGWSIGSPYQSLWKALNQFLLESGFSGDITHDADVSRAKDEHAFKG